MAKVKRHKKIARKKSGLKNVLHPKNLYQEKYFYILGVALLILLFVVGVKILFANASYVGAGNGGPANPGTTTTSQTTKAQPSIPDNTFNCVHSKITDRGQLISELGKEFGITLSGNLGSGVDRPLQIYNTMCTLEKHYGKYFSNLTKNGTKINVELVLGGAGKTCLGGWTPPHGSNTKLINLGWCNGSSNRVQAANRFVLVHETGHLMIDRGYNVYNQYLSKIWGKNSWLPTWNCINAETKADPGTSHVHECFGDMVGEFLIYGVYQHDNLNSGYVGDFRGWSSSSNKYHNWYNFAKTYIFGNDSNGSFNPNEFGYASGNGSGGGGILAAPVDQSKSCSAYMQSQACNSTPDKGTTNAIITKCTQYGLPSYNCYNPNKANVSWYTQMNSCASAPFAGNGTTYTAKGHKFLIRKENGVTSCVADCTVNSKIAHCN